MSNNWWRRVCVPYLFCGTQHWGSLEPVSPVDWSETAPVWSLRTPTARGCLHCSPHRAPTQANTAQWVSKGVVCRKLIPSHRHHITPLAIFHYDRLNTSSCWCRGVSDSSVSTEDGLSGSYMQTSPFWPEKYTGIHMLCLSSYAFILHWPLKILPSKPYSPIHTHTRSEGFIKVTIRWHHREKWWLLPVV